MFCPQSAGPNVKYDLASSSFVHISSTEQAVKARNSRRSKMNGTLILIYVQYIKSKMSGDKFLLRAGHRAQRMNSWT
jgi:hypothetical protein